MVYSVLRDPFWVWCEYHAPRTEAVDETSRYDEMRFQQAAAYEQDWVKKHYPDAVKIEPPYGMEALRSTIQTMLTSAPAIHGPQLWDLEHEIYGQGDLLVRDDSHGSDLGPYHYRLVEIKRSTALRDYQFLQAAFYQQILGRVQGYTPKTFTVALRGSDEQISYEGKVPELNALMEKWRALRDGTVVPEPSGRPPRVTDSPWRVYGQKRVTTEMDLVLLAGVGPKQREKLHEVGIHRVDQLWNLGLDETRRILGDSHGVAAYFVAQAYRTGRPIGKPGIPLAIPRGRRHLYFDFETSDEVHPTEPPHVYLIGLWDAEQGRFVSFLAKGAGEEERMFREFLDYAGDLETVRLYHWTDYEIGQMVQVMDRWPALRDPLKRLISSCVDLKEAIKSAVYLPVPTFSLKSVAPALGFRWRQEGFGAFESMVSYWDYLSGDESEIQKTILYNEDDCVAMWHVDREITRLFGAPIQQELF
jgi:uncharacterized protein